MTHEYEVTITSEEPLGQFIDASLEQFLGGDRGGISVKVEKINE